MKFLTNRAAVSVLALLMGGASVNALADTCMVSPTSKSEVSGRFGMLREAGAFGSGADKPHMHDGLDFSTSGVAAPLYATTAGTVIWAKMRGSAGNTVMIKRDNGQIATYYHLASISVKEGETVQAGQQIGLSGNTGMKPNGAVHLHFVYGVPNSDDARAKSFSEAASRNPVFNPAQLPNAIQKRDFGYATDPSPYFCSTLPIQRDALTPVLGSDTMTQYSKLFGSAPPMGVPPSTYFDPVQVAAANVSALIATFKGAPSIASFFSDADGYGSLPSPPLGDYETMSPAEMLTTEAKRRFSDAQWNTNITQVGARALWVDYLRALGVSSYLNEAIRQKKERVEALLALYTSQKLAPQKARVVAAQERALRADVARTIE